MKKWILTLFGLQFISVLCFSQNTSKEQLTREIEAFKAAAYKAAETFLNTRNPVETRLSSLSNFPFIYDEAQIAAAKKILLNEQEDAKIRGLALSRLVSQVPDDEALGDKVIKWLQDTSTPKDLRIEALNTVKALSFSGFTQFKKRQEIVSTLRTIMKDPELPYREFALNFLMDHGDSFAESLIVDQLEKKQTSLLPTADMLRLLSLNPKGDYLPTVYKIFQNPPNKESKIESIALLGNYAPAKKSIVALLKDKKQSEEVRSVVLSTLNTSYPEEFAGLVQNMIIDETEPVNIRVAAIVMETYRRKSNQQRVKHVVPDDFEKNVKKLKANSSPAIRKASDQYLEDKL